MSLTCLVNVVLPMFLISHPYQLRFVFIRSVTMAIASIDSPAPGPLFSIEFRT